MEETALAVLGVIDDGAISLLGPHRATEDSEPARQTAQATSRLLEEELLVFSSPQPTSMQTLVAREHGTPVYLYEAQQVRDAWARFSQAFSYPHTQIHYAIVCNKNPYLVRLLNELGAGVHANTPGDAYAALAAGVPADKILYSGTNLDTGDMEYLLGQGLSLILDSLDQLRLRARYGPGSVGLRLWLPEGAPRIGLDPEELPQALEIAERANLSVQGLHMYTATNNRKADNFLRAFERLVETSALLPDLKFLDLGGGYGVDYRRGGLDLDLETLGATVSALMETVSRERGRPVTLILEPGRILVARSGTLLVTVISVKERQGRRFVGVDSTVGNVVVESVYHPYHAVEAVTPRGEPLDIPTDICGNTTHSRDYLARQCKLPHLEVGDLLALRDVGAYGYAMSSHFLNRPRPPEVVLDEGRLVLTTRRETFQDLLRNQVAL